MKISILAVGDAAQYELLFRASCEYIRQEAAALGYEFAGARELAAESEPLFGALAQTAEDSEVIIILQSGEPAVPPLVAQTCARGLGMELTSDASRMAMLVNYARRSGRELTQEELAGFLAMPKGACVIPNTSGLVQGWYVSAARQMMLALPAAPSELSSLFPGQVRQLLSAFAGNASTSYAVLRAADLDDVALEDTLRALRASANPKISWSSLGGDYEIYIEAQGVTAAEADGLRDAAVNKLRAQLGPYCYGEGRETLQELVVHKYASLGATIATAESCTGGLLSERITEVSGSSAVFEFGLSAYANRVKVEKLGVPKSFIQDYGAISRQTAAAMAIGARKRGKAEVGVGITGNAGPSGDEGKPVGLVYVALADEKSVWVKKLLIQRPDADREYIRSVAALQALNMLRLYGIAGGANMPGGVPAAKVMSSGGLLGGIGMFAKPRAGKEKPTGETALSAVKRLQKRDGANKNEKEADTMNDAVKTNLIQRIKTKQLTKNDKIRIGILGLCLLIFIGCMIYIGSVKLESVNTAKQNNAITDIFKAQATQEEIDHLPAGYLEEFATLYAQNEDIAGWVEIEGTKLDYAVVQTNNNEYYSRRDFYGNDNQHGIPFVDFRCDLSIPSTNTIIYGHNMNDGQMFGELENYRQIGFYREHPLINFHSVYYKGIYKILGIVICMADDEDFLYHSEINLSSTDLHNFVAEIAKRSIITTTVDVQDGDRLLTLSTCDYSFRDDAGNHIARLVVFGRKVRDGESTAVDTAGAFLNPNPLMPQEWFEYIKRMQDEAELKAAEEAAAALAAGNLAKWLSEEEKETLSTEEATALATSRKEQAELYLTAAERDDELTELWEKLELIDYRTRYFALFLSDEDRARENVSAKLELADANYQLYLGVLGSNVLEKLTTWQQLQEIIASFKSVTDAAATIPALHTGATGTPTLALSPEGSVYKSVEWSAPGDIITIDKKTGAITANKAGAVTITLTITNFDNTVVKKTFNVTVTDKAIIPITAVSFAAAPADVVVGKTAELKLTITPADGVYKKIEWKSSANADATVAGNGLAATVTGVTAGKSVTITATVINNDGSTGVSATHTIAVKAAGINATGGTIAVASGANPVVVGGTLGLNLTLTPAGATYTGIAWSSSDNTAATVTGSGLTATVTGVTAGKSANIIATVTNSDGSAGYSATYPVTVTAAAATVTGITFSQGDNLTMETGASGTLTPVVTMSDGSAYAGAFDWSAEGSVSVSAGVVTANAAGSGKVTVTAGGKSHSVNITVSAPSAPEPPTPPATPTTVVTISGSAPMPVGGTAPLSATVSMSDGTAPLSDNVTWSDDGSGVVTVDPATGTVTANAAGTATVTATAADGTTSSVTITVS